MAQPLAKKKNTRKAKVRGDNEVNRKTRTRQKLKANHREQLDYVERPELMSDHKIEKTVSHLKRA